MAANVNGVPAVIKGHRHFSYGGATLPESVTIEQYYDLTPTKKSNLRMADELLPKPTEINIGEKVIKASIPREHPYHSHISSCSMFPTYCHLDDPHTGVQTDSSLPFIPHVPASATQVTVLSKTKGAPFRHELHKVPMATSACTTVCSGQNGLQSLSMLGKESAQDFWPTPQKVLCINHTQQEKNTTLPERTANALNNLEKTRWLTSNQLDYTGTGPTNPIQQDDFDEKRNSMIMGEVIPYRTQLRERSYPIVLPSRPLAGRKARILQNRRPLESGYRHLDLSRSSSMCEVCLERNCVCRLNALNGKDAVEARTIQLLEQHNFQAALQEKNTRNPTYISGNNHSELYPPATVNLDETDRFVDLKRSVTGSEVEGKDRVLPVPPIQARPHTFHFSNREGASCSASRSILQELQDSFSQSDVHRHFHESMKTQGLDLRDNHHSGRKHFFYGFNSYFFRN